MSYEEQGCLTKRVREASPPRRAIGTDCRGGMCGDPLDRRLSSSVPSERAARKLQAACVDQLDDNVYSSIIQSVNDASHAQEGTHAGP